MDNIKLFFKGELKLLSPLIIGSGEDNNTDNDVLLNSKDEPFIPATSIAGVISSFIEDVDCPNKEQILGRGDNQSEIVFYDLFIKENGNFSISKRDGIAIDNEKGIGKDKSKYDYEIIDKGSIFNFEFLLNFNDKKFIKTIIDAFNSKKIRIGAKTNNGYGEVELINYHIYEYDFSKKEHVLKWLKKEDGEGITEKFDDIKAYMRKLNFINLLFEFEIKDSLIIKSYDVDDDNADSVHLKSGNDFIISGSSLKGSLRARAERIYNTLGVDSEKMLKDLFGAKGESKGSGQKGRLSVNEVKLSGVDSDIQQRIKIDRFTGGTITGALFGSKPVFNKENNTNKMRIEVINAKKSDLGILLLLLKDLWTEDLPIGGEKNIGRGVLKGKEAVLTYNLGAGDKNIQIGNDLKGLEENIDFFQSCVNEIKSEGLK